MNRNLGAACAILAFTATMAPVLGASMALAPSAVARCEVSLEIRPPDGESSFPGLVVRSVDPPTGPIELEPGDLLYGYVVTLGRTGACSGDLRLEWQYETTMAVGDDGPHLDLQDWKHFTSEWREVERRPDGLYTLPTPGVEEASRFPPFTHGELVDTVRHAGGERWEWLVSTPEAADASTYVGVSSYRLRVVDGAAMHHPLVVLELSLPLGC